ncbi:MAG: NifB/NifX family molybdenum-iron cluster-binding protein [Clostridiaceae bacterium]|nr:NifB/NifX family molybdenum-iron cluster-binding protein [Clostridiaceae bacterium]
MKLAIPVESESLQAPVCASFGRTPFYALYDTETDTCEFLDNSALSSQGGAGIKAAQTLVDHSAEAIITYRCGDNAAQVLNAAKIEIFKAQDGTVIENIDKFKKAELSPLSEIHSGLHHHGGGME